MITKLNLKVSNNFLEIVQDNNVPIYISDLPTFFSQINFNYSDIDTIRFEIIDNNTFNSIEYNNGSKLNNKFDLVLTDLFDKLNSDLGIKVLGLFDDDLKIIMNNVIKQIQNITSDFIKSITMGAAYYEIQSWETQRQEYLRYKDSNLASTPYVDTLALSRNLTRDELFLKIESKIVNIAKIQGFQHKTEDDIKLFTTKQQCFDILTNYPKLLLLSLNNNISLI